MHIFNVFYYHYFLFYKKIIKDPEPHFATVLALSFNQSLFINGTMDFVALKLFCYQIAVWVQFAILLLIIYLNYLVFHRSGKTRKIIREKPRIGNSNGLSIGVTLLFFLVTSSWLFWGPIYGKQVLSHCR